MAFDPDRLRQELMSATTPETCLERLIALFRYEGLSAILYTTGSARLATSGAPRSTLLKFSGSFAAEYMTAYHENDFSEVDVGVDLCMPEPGTWRARRPFHHWNGEYMYNLTRRQLEVETFTLKRFDGGITFALPEELGLFGGFSIGCDQISRVEFWDIIRGNHAHIVSFIEMFHRRYQQLLVQVDTALIADWGLGEALASDWRSFRFGDVKFNFGVYQANVVRMLFEAQAHNKPWVSGKTLQKEVGFGSSRLVDLFKSKPHWRRLIFSDARGNYRLNLNPECVQETIG